MDGVDRIQHLRDEIDEITALINKWAPGSDQETRLAIDMLVCCLERRESALRRLLN